MFETLLVFLTIMEGVWIFHGNNGRFAGGVFTEPAKAEEWIHKNRLTGVLTLYPLNTGVYEWAIENSLFSPKKEAHYTPEFIGKFSSAGQDHFHYENGERA